MKKTVFLILVVLLMASIPVFSIAPDKTAPNQSPPFGTQPATPAQPAVPGEQPATPAQPAQPGKPEHPETPEHPSKPENPEKPSTPENQTQLPGEPEIPQQTPTPPAPVMPPVAPLPPGNAPTPPAPPISPPTGAVEKPLKNVGAAASGIFGMIIPDKDKKDKKPEKKHKEEQKPATIISSAADNATKTELTVSSTVTATTITELTPLFSEGKGPKIAVLDFEGYNGAETAEIISETLKKDFRVYRREELKDKVTSPFEINRKNIKKLAGQIEVDWLVYGKVSNKSETLCILSIYLRDAATGDIKLTDNQRFILTTNYVETVLRRLPKAAGVLLMPVPLFLFRVLRMERITCMLLLKTAQEMLALKRADSR